MSQQINLLPPPSRNLLVPGSIAGLVLFLLLAGFYVRSSTAELSRVRQDAAQSNERVEKLRSAIAGLQDPKRREAAAKLDAEIAQMRERSAGAMDFIRQVDSGALGKASGYPGVFEALAASAQDDVWITRVSISKNGTAVMVVGSAISNEAALQYARRAGERMRDAGVKFQTLELKPGSATAGGPSIVTFTLS